MKQGDLPDHDLIVERPGRHGANSVTATCVCAGWLRTVFRETTVAGRVVPDLDAAEQAARTAWNQHEQEIPELRRQAAAVEAMLIANEAQRAGQADRRAHASEVTIDA